MTTPSVYTFNELLEKYGSEVLKPGYWPSTPEDMICARVLACYFINIIEKDSNGFKKARSNDIAVIEEYSENDSKENIRILENLIQRTAFNQSVQKPNSLSTMNITSINELKIQKKSENELTYILKCEKFNNYQYPKKIRFDVEYKVDDLGTMKKSSLLKERRIISNSEFSLTNSSKLPPLPFITSRL